MTAGGRAPASEDVGEQTARPRGRAVVVAMKPQLRGRVRRNVETLLELGLEVRVVSIRTRKEFFVGLSSPLLDARFLEARTAHARFVLWRHRAERRELVRSRLRLDRARRAHLRRAWRLRRSPGRMVRHLVDQPVHAVSHGRPLRPFPRPVLSALVAVLVPTALVSALLAALVGVLHLASTTPVADARPLRAVGSRRRRHGADVVARRPSVMAVMMRFARALRPVARWVRLTLWEPAARWTARLRRWALDRVEDALRRTSRIDRFRRFWDESEAEVLDFRPDVVVSSDLPGLVGASRAARRLGVRHVHDCHELYLESTNFTWYERLLLAPVERRHMRRVSRVVVVNQSIADEYRRRYGVVGAVVRNCANVPPRTEVRDIREPAGLGPDSRVVLYQGGFAGGRGLDVCVAAVPYLPPDVHLVLLGYGALEHALLEQAAELGVADRVHVVAAVPPAELLAYTASGTVGLIPYQPVSLNNRYSLPNKIFEYTSVGLPVVASDLPELRRVAVDGGCGVVYDPYDVDSLVAALRTALEPETNARLRVGSRAYGQTHVWPRERQVLVEAFEAALARDPR